MKLNPLYLLPLCLLGNGTQAVELPQRTQAANLQAGQPNITRMIVKLRPTAPDINGMSKADSVAMIVSTRTGLQTAFHRNTALGASVMKLAAPLSLQDAEAYAQRIQADPNVEYAEPDKLLQPMDATLPNDPRYPAQWSYADPKDGNAGAINLPLAWGG
jgi:serine protease